jgi:hypothetical protein
MPKSQKPRNWNAERDKLIKQIGDMVDGFLLKREDVWVNEFLLQQDILVLLKQYLSRKGSDDDAAKQALLKDIKGLLKCVKIRGEPKGTTR